MCIYVYVFMLVMSFCESRGGGLALCLSSTQLPSFTESRNEYTERWTERVPIFRRLSVWWELCDTQDTDRHTDLMR